MITMDNYEGWLMRYIDGELSDSEHAEVERFLQDHPEQREEMEELRKLFVTAPLATFAGKEALLKKESLAWTPSRRASAAAVLLLLAGGVWLLQHNHSKEKSLIAKAEALEPTKTTPPQALLKKTELLEPIEPIKPIDPIKPIEPLEIPELPAPQPPALIAEENTLPSSIPRLRGGVLVVETTGLVQQEAQLATSDTPSTLEKIQDIFMKPTEK